MSPRIKETEVAFCADVKSWTDALCQARDDLPFGGAKIEQYGRGNRKRQDIRIFSRGSGGKPVLCGEVKLPGTPEGRNAYDESLVKDAFDKAENIQCRHFFTWNVNTLVLFDRQMWEEALLDRRVRQWELGLRLTRPEDVFRPDVQAAIKGKLLPTFLTDFADIYLERTPDWGMEPDELFIRSLEQHLDWPVHETYLFLAQEADRSRAFDTRLQMWMAKEQEWTFTRKDPKQWGEALERAARSLCYVLSNRIIFYEAVRARFDLPRLTISGRLRTADQIYEHFQKRFQGAVEATGDYEPIFYPYERDWAGPLVFQAEGSRNAWKSVLKHIPRYSFQSVTHDIVGGIFQKLISPEERHRFGQHYTNEDIVDVINSFCIRRPEATVLDPACGSGSFLVRAYYRKGWLSEHPVKYASHHSHHKPHWEMLQEIYGCDIGLFAAHLATFNLAARRIEQEENYPMITRKNFFDVEPDQTFCRIPIRMPDGTLTGHEVNLPPLDAIVGNPPYVRQELIPRANQKRVPKTQTKEYMQDLVSRAWPGLNLGGRSDLHCYFWPTAARFLKENGYFGFLTSSSWIDVEYGFPLQAWILQNFKLIAVMESTDEPWFEDARVKTCVTILQRCSDTKKNMQNLVRFVQFRKPIAEVLGERPAGDEGARIAASDQLRNLIQRARKDRSTKEMRILAVRQEDLWKQGVKTACLVQPGSKRKSIARPNPKSLLNGNPESKIHDSKPSPTTKSAIKQPSLTT